MKNVNDVINFKALNKKSKVTKKTGVVKKVFSDRYEVQSKHKIYEVLFEDTI